ncbi:MAG: hypothetical protein WCK16_00260 [Candidatus Moraniibacteriota bacterium]
MKIKILAAPFLIVIIITMIIWYIYPAYTNGFDGVREKKAKLLIQESLAKNLENTINNAELLKADLVANYLENGAVFSYIPSDKEEEKIIENLNSLSKDSALSVLNISISEAKEAVAVTEAATAGLSVNPIPGLTPDAPIQAPITPKAESRKLEVKLSVIGDYGNIKILIDKIQKLKRFNALSTLEIKTFSKEDQSISESLQANITLEFNYLKELKRLVDGDINNPVFATGVFNKQVVGKIKSSRSIDVNNVSPGQKSGNNPFIIAK